MNWYKTAQLQKNAGIMRTIGILFAVGLAHAAIVAWLVGNVPNITPDVAEQLVTKYERSSGGETEATEVDSQENAEPNDSQVNDGDGGENAEDMIQRHEGLRTTSYADADGRSIGYGFYLDNPQSRARIESLGLDYDEVYAGRQSITPEQARELFEYSMEDARATAQRFAPNLDNLPQTAQNVLLDMSYNLGNRIFTFRDMRQAVTDQNWENMAREMVDSDWYGQTGNRSAELVRMVNQL